VVILIFADQILNCTLCCSYKYKYSWTHCEWFETQHLINRPTNQRSVC